MSRAVVIVLSLLALLPALALEAIELPRQNSDVQLRILDLRGNNTPSLDTPCVYIVKVINEGSIDCSGFYATVNINFSKEIGQSELYPLAAGATMEVPVPCVFELSNFLSPLRAVLYIDGVSEAVTNQSVSLRADTFGSSYTLAAYSRDDHESEAPMDLRYKSNLFQCIFHEREIRQTGRITALRIFKYFGYSNITRSIKVWLGHTQQSELTEGFISPHLMTLVFDGAVTIQGGFGMMGVSLHTPFDYQGGNLVMLIQMPWADVPLQNSNQFLGLVNPGIRFRQARSSTLALSPYDPPQNSYSGGFVPLTAFGFSAYLPQAQCLVTPDSLDFGRVAQGSDLSQSIAIMNQGQSPLEISDIQILGSSAFSLKALPALPLTLPMSRRIEIAVLLEGENTGTKHATVVLKGQDGSILGSSSLRAEIETREYSLPLFEDFAWAQGYELPHGWDMINNSTAPSALIGCTQSQGCQTPGAAFMFNSADSNAPLYLVTPPFSASSSVTTYRIKFWAKASWPLPLQLGLIPESLNAEDFSPKAFFDLSTDWTNHYVDISRPPDGYRIAFRHGGGASSVYIWLDDISIEAVPLHDLAVQKLSGPAQPLLGALVRHQIELKNWGAVSENDYQVWLMDQNENILWQGSGPALQALGTQVIEASWYPSGSGPMTLKARVILSGDEAPWNDLSQPYQIEVVQSDNAYLVLGENRRQENLPLNFNSNNSLYEVIIPRQQLQGFYGQITGLSLYCSFANPMNNKPVKPWMGSTGRDDLSAAWIPSSQLTLVYDGSVSIAPGLQTLNFSFDEAFDYRDGRNLVIMFNRAWEVLSYSPNNRFQSWNIPSGLALGASSSSLTIDPALPIEGTPLDFCPLIRFGLQYGGVGNFCGRVLDSYGMPLPDALISVSDSQYETLSDPEGRFQLQNLLSGSNAVSISKHGYRPFTWTVEIPDGGTLASEYRLSSYPQINIQGRILSSDTQNPLAVARIRIWGYDEAEMLSGGDGSFQFANIWGEHSYSFSITASGYAPLNGVWDLGNQDLSLGDLILNELAWPAHTVMAVADDLDSPAQIDWQPPSEQASFITEDFESDSFPPPGWEQMITNPDPAGTSGILPTWSSFGPVSIDGTVVIPPSGSRQAGLWWSFSHQDEWLITPLFNCPPEALLSFETWCRYGSNAGDSYSVKLTTDGGQNWITLWNASDLEPSWNQYQTPVHLDLSAWGGSSVKLAWHADDPDTNDGLWYVWFIDAVSVSNATGPLSFFEEGDHPSRSSAQKTSALAGSAIPAGSSSKDPHQQTPGSTQNREHSGYRIARGFRAAEASQEIWTQLTDQPQSVTTYSDDGWPSLMDGLYHWSVTAIYANGVLAPPAVSNTVIRQSISGSLAGIVRSAGLAPLQNAIIHAGQYQASSNSAGAYNLILPIGVYDVTASAPGYVSSTQTDTIISEGLVTTLNFYLNPGSETDDPSAPALRTALIGSHPNPFRQGCSLELELAKSSRLKLSIYDIRGRKVSIIKDGQLLPGRHRIAWIAVDECGRTLPSGVYVLRMEAGDEVFSRKLILLK